MNPFRRARAITCPVCGAIPGKRCALSKGGRRTDAVHQARYLKANGRLLPPPPDAKEEP